VIVVAAFEAPTVVATLDDVAVVSQTVEQCGGHLGVAESAGPFTEGKMGGDDDGCTLVEPVGEMEQQLAAGLGERQVAKFVEDDEVHPGQMLGDPTLPSVAGLDLQTVDEVDYIIGPACAPDRMQLLSVGFGGACRDEILRTCQTAT
jgi:hypothetical protein